MFSNVFSNEFSVIFIFLPVRFSWKLNFLCYRKRKQTSLYCKISFQRGFLCISFCGNVLKPSSAPGGFTGGGSQTPPGRVSPCQPGPPHPPSPAYLHQSCLYPLLPCSTRLANARSSRYRHVSERGVGCLRCLRGFPGAGCG